MFLKKYNIKSKNIPLMYTIDFLGGLMFFLPVLALYFEQGLFSIKNVGIIFSIEAISVAIFEIPTGVLSDRLGRKKTYTATYIAILIALCFLLIGGSMIMFASYAIFSGLAMALASGNSQSLLYDSLAKEKKEKYYKKAIGTLYAVWPLGAAFGSIIGGYMAHTSLTTPIVYTFVPITIAIILTLFLDEPKGHKTEDGSIYHHIGNSIKTILNNNQLSLLILGWLLLMSLGEGMNLLKPIFLEFKEVPIAHFGYVFAAIFILSAISHYIGHDLSERFGNKRTLIVCLLLSPILIIASTMMHGYVAAIFLILPSILFGIRNTIIDYLYNRAIPSSHRATINSINSFVSKLGIAILVPLIGYSADLYTINIAFLIGAVLMLLVPILFMFIEKDNKKLPSLKE
jgi:MFS family permease